MAGWKVAKIASERTDGLSSFAERVDSALEASKANGEPQRGVIFDLDGTLVQSTFQAAEAKVSVLRRVSELGVDTSNIDSTRSMMEILAEVRSRVRGGEVQSADVEKGIGEVLDRFDIESLSGAELREDAKLVLDSLISRGLKLSIVTNSGRLAVGAALDALKLARYFTAVITRDDVHLLKPSSEGVLNALRRMGCDGASVAFVGDSWIDIRAAKGANVKSIALVGGMSSLERLKQESPDVLIKSLKELLRVV